MLLLKPFYKLELINDATPYGVRNGNFLLLKPSFKKTLDLIFLYNIKNLPMITPPLDWYKNNTHIFDYKFSGGYLRKDLMPFHLIRPSTHNLEISNKF
jgi:hypothetical protein